ncbi:MAG: hypothetical protein WA194_08205 [Patescibacteria group bacterium]
MVLKNTLRAVSLIAVFAVPVASYAAFDSGVAKADVTDAIARLVSKYEARIAELEAENASLKAQLASGKASTGSVAVTAPAASGTLGPAPLDEDVQTAKPAATVKPATPVSTATGASTGNAEYDALIKATNAALPSILKENGLSETSQLGLYEFVSGQKAFFVSIDDGKNPAGVTAFKTKILFTYDAKLATAVAGIFDLNYDVQRYKTTFGGNPFAAVARIRVKNPAYTGKLLEESATAPASTGSSTSTATATTTTTTSTTTTVSADVTAKSVRAAYDKNKLADAIKLANVYLAKNPNDVDILTVRYRSLYITGKFADSLKDVASIEALQGSKFDCTIAKDAAFIAKSAKDAAAATKYSAIVTACKK